MSAGDSWLVRPGDSADVSRIGGKAAGLDRLVILGLSVPDFIVLTADAYRSCCPDGEVPATIGPQLDDVLDSMWSELGEGATPLAVRSSAVSEDSAGRSWAGQMETSLNVTTRAGLARAVLGCWRSLHSERASVYRTLTAGGEGVEMQDEAMAVVVQHMLSPRASGVLFTVDPVTGDKERIVVSAVLGVGEGLVSGALDADMYVVGRDGVVMESEVIPKEVRFVAAPNGGLREEAVAATEAIAPALSEPELGELIERALQAERAAGVGLDIEFALEEGRLFFLQARPITTGAPPADRTSVNRLTWDNSNIVESYPDITLPLTFSFIRRAYHAVYWQFCQLLGMGDDEIRANQHMLSNMLGLHQGRVYYNIRNWYRLVSILPGFRHNRQFMEGMMGVSQEGGDEAGDRVSRSRGLLSLASTAVRAVWLQATLGRRVARFHETFDRVYAEFEAEPYETMEPAELLDRYRRVEQALLWQWQAPIVNDFSVMVFYGLLKRLTVQWGVDPEGMLHNALVSGQGGIESTEVSDRLEELADAVRSDAELRKALEADVDGAFDLLLAHDTCGPTLEAYMRRFGDRCVAELKLESRTMHDDPKPLVSALLASVRRDATHQEYVRPDVSGDAEAAVRDNLSWWRRVVYSWVLTRARAGIRNRENQRLARTRAFALVRRMMRSVGRELAASGLLEAWDDVFYLELDELMGLCDGTATLADPRGLVAARKDEFRTFEAAEPLPDRFITYGTAVTSVRTPDLPPMSEDGALRGLAAYPGVVERSAVVLLKPDGNARLEGDILVARQTDPGWVILFPSIGGLVVERGSMLSHSAIVAREMGIPTVVGVRGATEAIRTGDRLRLDGGAGVVHVLERAEESDSS